MKYKNANDILPKELLSTIQKYYQGGYLYIPKCSAAASADQIPRQKTAYQIELENRDQHLYLKHLEGAANRQLGTVFHLSQSSIRRIIARQKGKHQTMKKTIEQLLPLWGMQNRQVTQIYPSAWEIAPSHVIKLYYDKDQLERNIKISSILADCRIPVSQITHTQTGEQYATAQDAYFLMSEKLPGSNLFDLQDKKTAYEMGRAIARLHLAFVQCEKEMEFWDNSLLTEMKGWIPETLSAHNWPHITESEHARFVCMLEKVSDRLPRQLIHRDVHFGNFLFHEGHLSGYIDFDLSQKNIRIFDLCYFLAGLLAEETETPLTKEQWLELVHAVITGYESVNRLSDIEIQAVPCVMECIEILFVAYFTGTQDTKHAQDACRIFHQLQDYEAAIEKTLSAGRLT